MQLSEFKAWFEGFTEGMDGPPNEKQWARIQAKIKEIDGAPVTPVYIERYRDIYPRWYRSYEGWTSSYSTNAVPLSMTQRQRSAFDGHAAMRALGKAEAVS